MLVQVRGSTRTNRTQVSVKTTRYIFLDVDVHDTHRDVVTIWFGPVERSSGLRLSHSEGYFLFIPSFSLIHPVRPLFFSTKVYLGPQSLSDSESTPSLYI